MLRAFGVADRERAEVLPRPDLDEHAIGIAQQHADGIRETHWLAELSAPVGRIGRLRFADPVAGSRRDPGDGRSAERYAAERLGESREHRVHHRGMKRVRGRERFAADAPLGERTAELVDCFAWTRYHREIDGVDCGHGDGRGEQRLELGRRQTNREHAAAR